RWRSTRDRPCPPGSTTRDARLPTSDSAARRGLESDNEVTREPTPGSRSGEKSRTAASPLGERLLDTKRTCADERVEVYVIEFRPAYRVLVRLAQGSAPGLRQR